MVPGKRKVTTILTFQPDRIPHLIGKKGWRIKAIQEETNTRIVINNGVDFAGNAVCEIFGNFVARREAETKILDFIHIRAKSNSEVKANKTASQQRQSSKKEWHPNILEPEESSLCRRLFCEEEFSSWEKYVRHAKVEHRTHYSYTRGNVALTMASKSGECPTCFQSFRDHRSLLIHLGQQRTGENFDQSRLRSSYRTGQFQNKLQLVTHKIAGNYIEKRIPWAKTVLTSVHRTPNLSLTLFNDALVIGPPISD